MTKMSDFKPGMNWQDLQKSAGIDEVLGSARDAELVEVAIVGRKANGDVVLFASHPNLDAVSGLLMRGVTWAALRLQLDEGNADEGSL